MRKYLEQDMLADALKGCVRYGCTAYVGMDGCRIFEVCIDGKQVKRFFVGDRQLVFYRQRAQG